MRDCLRQYELDPTTGISINPRRKKYKINDQAIKNLVTQFDQIDEPDDEAFYHHLRAIQYRLMNNDMDNWENDFNIYLNKLLQ